ncbi:hypothetical protein DFH28DRAFT_472461 [Melampsora americana]|nr:hypothetical protein DFH28DRAFT_472461 [Melampsora americana]
MDIILNKADEIFLDCLWSTVFPIEPNSNFSSSSSSSNHPHHQTLKTIPSRICQSTFERQNLFRQSISIYLLALISVPILYFSLGSLSFYFLFDHRLMNHPRFLKNQIQLEIKASLRAMAPMVILTLPIFLAEVRGYSLLYDNVNDFNGLPISKFMNSIYLTLSNLIGFQPILPNWLNSLIRSDLYLFGNWTYLIFSQFFFLWFTDFAIYLVHRWIHTPSIYKYIHKSHHKWIIPTPFASYAFNPLDGFLQSLPYHLFIFIFPLHKTVYLSLFVFVNLWSILIHDSDLIVGHPLEHIINGPSHHTLHHLHFTCNYGQYFTWADRLGQTYRHPIQEDQIDLIHSSQKKFNQIKSNLSTLDSIKNVQEDQFDEQILSSSSSSSSHSSHHSHSSSSSDEGLIDHQDLTSHSSSSSFTLLSSPTSSSNHQITNSIKLKKRKV